MFESNIVVGYIIKASFAIIASILLGGSIELEIDTIGARQTSILGEHHVLALGLVLAQVSSAPKEEEYPENQHRGRDIESVRKTVVLDIVILAVAGESIGKLCGKSKICKH